MSTKRIPAETSLSSVLRAELKTLFEGGSAHARFDEAVKDFPHQLQGTVPDKLPYSGWQLLEHLRIAQRDILDFCRNEDGSYRPQKWPDDYWPKDAAPPSDKAWQSAVEAVLADRASFEQLLEGTSDEALTRTFAWGDGQTLLHEALLVADHSAYHIGELIMLRRLLNAWHK